MSTLRSALAPIHASILAGSIVFAAGAAAAAEPCAPSSRTLCLLGGRLRVSAGWEDAAPGGAVALGDGAGAFLAADGSPALVVRVVDDRQRSGTFRLLRAVAPGAGAARDVRLTIEDLAAGTVRHVASQEDEGESSAAEALAPDAGPGAAGAAAREAQGALAIAAVGADGVPLAATVLDPGAFAFFDVGSADPVLVVAAVDGRAVNGRWWLLTSAARAGEWTVRVRDRSSGRVNTIQVSADRALTRLVAEALAAPTVVAVLDGARAAKQTIGAAGGVVRAVAANGTRFTLTLPPRALASSVEVTLTPLKSLTGLPFSALAGAVEIGPANLRFGVTVALAVQPKAPVALPQETTFGYRVHGAQFFLYPAALRQRAVVLEVIHSGGYGLARATASQQAAQGARLPPKDEDRFSQRLWKPQWQARQVFAHAAAPIERAAHAAAPLEGAAHAAAPLEGAAAELAGSAGVGAFFAAEFAALRHEEDLISQSCNKMKAYGGSVRNYIAMAEDDELASPQLGHELALAKSALRAGDALCYREATSKCNAGDHTQPMPAIRWWWQLQLDEGTFLVDARQLERCLVFDLEWDTLVEHHNTPPEGYLISANHRLDTHDLIRFQVPPAGLPIGTAAATPNVYVYANWLGGAPHHCSSITLGARTPISLFAVKLLSLEANFYEDTPPPPRIDLIYNPGDPQVQLTQHCEGGDHTSPAGLFAPAYGFLHFLENPQVVSHTPAALWDYEPYPNSWKVPQGALWAVRSYAGSLGLADLYAVESTDLSLFHKPGH